MPGNESVTDNMKSFVGGVALKQAFYNIKTYNEQAISTAITTHNADAAHRHLPIAPTAATTAASGLASLNFLTNSSTPEWKTLPLATGYTTNSDDTLATGKAVKTAYDTLNTSKVNYSDGLQTGLSISGSLTDLSILPNSGHKLVIHQMPSSAAHKPCDDGYVITFVWKIKDATTNGASNDSYVRQFAFDDQTNKIYSRAMNKGVWSGWVQFAYQS